MNSFIDEDTYEGEITNPLTLNLYTYVHNNPLIHTDPSGNKVKFSQNQFDYLNNLRLKGNSGQKSWATYQLKNDMAYYDTKTKQIVSVCFDCAGEDNSPVYDVIGGLGTVGAKSAAKGITKAALKSGTKKVTSRLSNNAVDHYKKHVPIRFREQVKYLDKKVLEDKLANNTSFNPKWSEKQIFSYVEEGYSNARSKGITEKYDYKAKGEVINRRSV